MRTLKRKSAPEEELAPNLQPTAVINISPEERKQGKCGIVLAADVLDLVLPVEVKSGRGGQRVWSIPIIYQLPTISSFLMILRFISLFGLFHSDTDQMWSLGHSLVTACSPKMLVYAVFLSYFGIGRDFSPEFPSGQHVDTA